MFMIMNTAANTVEYDNIHLYRHLMYVNRPASIAKKEYHNLVSPRVRKGGLSSVSHSPMMKEASTAIADPEKEMAKVRRLRYRIEDTDQWSLAHIETTAPQADRTTDDIPNHMKLSQVIIFDIV